MTIRHRSPTASHSSRSLRAARRHLTATLALAALLLAGLALLAAPSRSDAQTLDPRASRSTVSAEPTSRPITQPAADADAPARPLSGNLPDQPDVRHPLDLIERPGELEFSGRLLAQPVSDAAMMQALARFEPVGARGFNDAQGAVANIAPDRIVRRYPDWNAVLIKVPAGQDDAAYCRALRASGAFVYIHPDWTCFPQVVPNDPQFSSQWHLTTMRAAQAWDLATGIPAARVAIVDSGVDITHSDLAPVVLPGFNSVGGGQTQAAGGVVTDVNGHGTACAGSAAAAGNNAIGVSGIGWNLRLIPVRCTDNPNGTASLSNILNGAVWASQNGARMVSISFTGVTNAAVGSAGTTLRQNGAVMCYAAGNQNSLLDASADWPDVVIVGATDQSDNRASFSNFGVPVDVTAPGVGIITTANGNAYTSANGTSFSTPIAAGALALAFSANSALNSNDIENALKGAAIDLGDPGKDPNFGWGRIDLLRTVQAARANPTNPIAPPNSAIVVAGGATFIDVLADDFDPRNRVPLTIPTFQTTTPNGGTISRSVATGPGGRDRLVYTAPSIVPAGGVDSFTYTVANTLNQSTVATVNITVQSAANYRTPENPVFVGQGLRATYYSLPSLSALPDFSTLSPLSTQIVPDVNFASTNGTFAGSGLSDDVGATFVGFLAVPTTDTYTLFTESDDGSSLFIGSTQVVGNDGLHAMVEQSGTINLQAGVHALRINFFEAGGGAGLIARIQGGPFTKQVIPAANLLFARSPADIADNASNPLPDGALDNGDFSLFVSSFFSADCTGPVPCNPADIADNGSNPGPDGLVDNGDFSLFITLFFAN
jgi:thermitase